MESMLLLAQSDDEIAGMISVGILLVFGTVMIAVVLAINAFICWLVSKTAAAIPPQFREIEPGSVWLLMIPCFPIVWNFFVYPRIASGYQRYFQATGNYQNGDCAAQLAQWYCLCVVFSVIPLVNYIAGPASFVLLIITMVKFWDYKGQAERGPANVTPTYATASAPLKKDPANPYA